MKQKKMNFIIKKLHFLICAVLIMAMMTGTVQAAYGSSFAGGGRTAGKYTISLYDRNGVMTQQVLKKKGASFTLPARKNPKGKTFLGWSLSREKTIPAYTAGKKIFVRKNMKLYPVYYNCGNEKTGEWGSLPRLNMSRYKMVIFVGDSRTYRMGLRFGQDDSTEGMTEVRFIGKGGAKLRWLQNSAFGELLNMVNQCNREDKSKKKIAVVFNLGVNDLSHKYRRVVNPDGISDSYAVYMNMLGCTLEAKNCRLFYMSVNPTNCRMSATEGLRKASEIERFNDLLRKKLSKRYKWINCTDYLTRTGYAFDSGVEQESGNDDGVHYTKATYQSIYRYCIRIINKS